MLTRAQLREVALFEHLRDDQADWIIGHSTVLELPSNTYVFRQGEPSDYWFVVLEGEMQIMEERDGGEFLLATHTKGAFSGEAPLLSGTPYIASARTLTQARLLRLDNQSFRDMFGVCPVIVSKLFGTLQWRIQTTEALARQREKLSALGVMAAGLAHELNNPAAAAARAADQLQMAIDAMHPPLIHMAGTLQSSQFEHLLKMRNDAVKHAADTDDLDSLTQSDREDEVGSWMDDHNLDNSWDMAPVFVSGGIDADQLDDLENVVGDEVLPDAIGWLYASLNAAELLHQVEQSTRRISSLVKAVKSYSYMDQAPQQEIDVHEGIEDTLTILAHKLRSHYITTVKHFDKTIPMIHAYGSELNQVWTNIIDNAIDAMFTAHGKGTLSISTRAEGDSVYIEIGDNGTGMPESVRAHIFEAFYTTKEVGKGTGLGLDIAHRIIFSRHRGDITVTSQQTDPSGTCFQIRLPIHANTAETGGSSVRED